MKKVAFWKRDWFLGLLVTLAMLVWAGSEFNQSLERKAYDIAVGMTSRQPSDKIAIIAIDQPSLVNIGRWPWSREVHAEMIDKLAGAKAKVIASTIFFSEPQLDPGLAYINKLIGIYGSAGGVDFSRDEVASETVAAQAGWLGSAGTILQEADARLNTDRRLAAAVKSSGNVVLPMAFKLGVLQGRPEPLPDYLQRNGLPGGNSAAVYSATELDAGVIEPIGTVAAAIGHLNATPDIDGGFRAEPLVVGYGENLYPSLSLLIAARSLNLGPADIQVQPGESLKLGNLNIGTDTASRMYVYYYKDKDGFPAFPVDSFFDVKSGKIPLEKYKDKIVLIGMTVAGSGSPAFVTPVSAQMSSVQVLAHTVSSILSEHFFVVPSWAGIAEFVVFLLVAIYLIALLPRLKAGTAAVITLGILIALLATHFVLMTTQLMWLQLMLPATLLLVGHALLTTKHFLLAERGKEKSDLDSAESNRMLGLAFQGQGQLDMAFDKFRKCPLDDQLMENLYNLALDFERKRQFNKAEAVFRYMSDYNPKFRDLEQRLQRARQMSETVILGGAGTRTNASILDGSSGTVEKPMLGRYQVEKELGKGAMGVVYQGRDPKINRIVAIKTMALAQEFDESELADVKERFFREAETAGRLNHPNIVTMYDAGEEHDLAYIAMEFLKGRDLVPYTKVGALLNTGQVTSIVARVADALSYAHSNNVVHRDIKPANIMYEPESDQVKVTDFGIARITDSSRTKTGMVLGTPSYMSPEQLAGKKIDGRSDIFSLGVTLYQMVSGHLPFEGDSMAQLMFRIANEPHPDVRTRNPEIPAALAAVIDRALAKDMTVRYQTGQELARDLRALVSATASGPSVDIAL
jgi:eukaryotic-like serine/threonine-protein kinase